jgi:hypothetical protein
MGKMRDWERTKDGKLEGGIVKHYIDRRKNSNHGLQ